MWNMDAKFHNLTLYTSKSQCRMYFFFKLDGKVAKIWLLVVLIVLFHWIWRKKFFGPYFSLSALYEAVRSSNSLEFISMKVLSTLYTRATIVWFQCSLDIRYNAGNIIGIITWLFSSMSDIIYSLFQKYRALSATCNQKSKRTVDQKLCTKQCLYLKFVITCEIKY